MAVKITVTETGVDEGAAAFRQFARELDTFASVAGRRPAMAIKRRAAFYDPPPKPSYRRTLFLKGSWFAKKAGKNRWIAGSTALYAKFVRGTQHRGPAFMHVGRWERWTAIVRGLAAPPNLKRRIAEGIETLKIKEFGR